MIGKGSEARAWPNLPDGTPLKMFLKGEDLTIRLFFYPFCGKHRHHGPNMDLLKESIGK
jgi:hypothetical protein